MTKNHIIKTIKTTNKNLWKGEEDILIMRIILIAKDDKLGAITAGNKGINLRIAWVKKRNQNAIIV